MLCALMAIWCARVKVEACGASCCDAFSTTLRRALDDKKTARKAALAFPCRCGPRAMRGGATGRAWRGAVAFLGRAPARLLLLLLLLLRFMVFYPAARAGWFSARSAAPAGAAGAGESRARRIERREEAYADDRRRWAAPGGAGSERAPGQGEARPSAQGARPRRHGRRERADTPPARLRGAGRGFIAACDLHQSAGHLVEGLVYL
jgi:hypothetical protein